MTANNKFGKCIHSFGEPRFHSLFPANILWVEKEEYARNKLRYYTQKVMPEER